MLKISSASVYEKLEYCLCGATAVLIVGDQSDDGSQQPTIEIKLDPSTQIEHITVLSFRLLSMDDISSWVAALSR